VSSVEARGKHLLLSFDDGAVLHTHMQMTGRWDVYRDDQRWRRPSHRARVVLEVDNGNTAVCFDAPTVELRRDRATRRSDVVARLGPDLCVTPVDFATVLANLARLPAGTPVADALLDQRVAAGVGNVFKSETCWHARVHPSTPVGALDVNARRALFDTAHRLLTAGRRDVAVYRRAGRRCRRCNATILTARTGAHVRSTYWCPVCQPDPTQNESTKAATPRTQAR
jgi:endonuclease-8